MKLIAQMKPKSKGELVILLGAFLWLSAKIVHYLLYPDFDLAMLQGEHSFGEWGLRLLRDIGFTVVTSGLVIHGIREWRKADMASGKIIVPIVGILFLVGWSAFGFYSSSKMKSFSLELYKTPSEVSGILKKLKEKVDDESIPVEERAIQSSRLAYITYQENGGLIDVLKEDGTLEPYKPTEEEIAFRNEYLTLREQSIWIQSSLHQSGVIAAIIATVSIFLGFYPNKKKSALS